MTATDTSLSLVEETLELLAVAGDQGLTWAEISDYTGHHHGNVSRVLSNLHRDGLVCRLTITRGRSKVYVLPEHVAGRGTERQGREKACPHCGEFL